MANPILGTLSTQVTNTVGVMQSAKVLISGSAARLEAAVAAALANGATAAELAPIQAEVDALKSGTDELAAAVAANPS